MDSPAGREAAVGLDLRWPKTRNWHYVFALCMICCLLLLATKINNNASYNDNNENRDEEQERSDADH